MNMQHIINRVSALRHKLDAGMITPVKCLNELSYIGIESRFEAKFSSGPFGFAQVQLVLFAPDKAFSALTVESDWMYRSDYCREVDFLTNSREIKAHMLSTMDKYMDLIETYSALELEPVKVQR